MRLLLDTHIWIWNALDTDRLSPRFVKALEDTANELWLSPISIWELLKLVEKGRVALRMDPVVWVREAIRQFPVREAPVTSEVALAVREVRLPHRDPADAFLVATARVLDLTLLTADRSLRRAKGISVF